jgi:hypothetical protein
MNIRQILNHLLVLTFCVACGTTDPSPVGINLVNLSGGEVVEMLDLRPVESGSHFREIFPTRLGAAEEMLIGRMNGVEYVGIFQVALSPEDFPGGDPATVTIDSLFVDLKILGSLNRGNLGALTVSAPGQAWTEAQSFVDSTDFQQASFVKSALLDVMPVRVDSTIRVSLPATLLEDAISQNPTAPVVEFALSGAEGLSFLIVSGTRETGIPDSTGAPVSQDKVPELVTYYAGESEPGRVGTSLDTYYADRIDPPAPGELLLQTGIFSGARMQFELPTIPESATVNQIELIMDFEFDRSFLSSLRLRFERLDVASGDTTAVIVSGNPLNEQIIAPVSSPLFMNLDQLMFHGWMSGTKENHGFSINPVFEITSDLRYEWGLFSNPRLRIVYSLPPSTGT